MRVCYQPTLAVPRDWLEVDSRDWHKTAAKSVPSGGEVINNKLGWIHRGCVQGIEFAGDQHEVLIDADCLMVLTEWAEFRNPNFKVLEKLLKQ